MRTSLLHFAAIAIVSVTTIGVSAQAPQQQAKPAQPASLVTHRIPTEATDNPIADPKAVIVSGNARFTVLTPELIRMEWAADGKFEDHASFVFINRRLH